MKYNKNSIFLKAFCEGYTRIVECINFSFADKPLCKKREVRMIGAALHEPSSVVCEVEAFPLPNTFEWTLNSSAGSIKIEPVNMKITVSNLLFFVMTIKLSATNRFMIKCQVFTYT